MNKCLAIRTRKAETLLSHDFRHDDRYHGSFGRAQEFILTPTLSRKVCIAPSGKADNFFYLDGKRTPVEIKTNRGKVDSLLRKYARGKNGFVVYVMDICNANTGNHHRTIAPRIYSLVEFVEGLCDTESIVCTRKHGKAYGMNIQATNYKWYEWAESHGIPYDPNKEYTSADFE